MNTLRDFLNSLHPSQARQLEDLANRIINIRILSIILKALLAALFILCKYVL